MEIYKDGEKINNFELTNNMKDERVQYKQDENQALLLKIFYL